MKDLKTFSVNEIKPYPKNAKKHPNKQLIAIARSIKEFGWQQPVVVDKDGVIIVGHGRYEAFIKYQKEMSLPQIRIETSNLDEQQAKAYRIADNKLNESDWDNDLLIEELKQLEKRLFDLTGFDEDKISEHEKQDDYIPEIPVKAKTKKGEMFKLGDHVLMCGDSTSEEDVKKLMGGGCY